MTDALGTSNVQMENIWILLELGFRCHNLFSPPLSIGLNNLWTFYLLDRTQHMRQASLYLFDPTIGLNMVLDCRRRPEY